MEGDLIYDIGMHNGDDTAYYLARGFRVVAVEADPTLAAAARRRFESEIQSGRLVVLNVGVAAESVAAVFWINEVESHFNSFSSEAVARFGHPNHSVVIECKRLDEIIAEFGIPHFMKIDIEGNDIICCEQLGSLTKPNFISVEMSQMNLLTRLRDLGYDRFKLIDQLSLRPVPAGDPSPYLQFLRWLHRGANHRRQDRSLLLKICRAVPARMLRVLDSTGEKRWGRSQPFVSRHLPEWNFKPGSSGTFGDDLPGEWLGWEDIARIWERDLHAHEKMGREFWCDLHATTAD